MQGLLQLVSQPFVEFLKKNKIRFRFLYERGYFFTVAIVGIQIDGDNAEDGGFPGCRIPRSNVGRVDFDGVHQTKQ